MRTLQVKIQLPFMNYGDVEYSHNLGMLAITFFKNPVVQVCFSWLITHYT
jgi:hypothetical protein